MTTGESDPRSTVAGPHANTLGSAVDAKRNSNMQTKPSRSAAINSALRIFQIYNRTKYLSNKHDSYFQVYEEVFSKYVGKVITFVEVGVLNGGSLFMWRDYFGPSARIVGVEFNPEAAKWRAEGFEIFIGDQADPAFWDDFYRQVGPVDVLLDDGGHGNAQQIVTAHKAIEHIRDGGTLVVEDVHTSYFREFGNPSKYSFITFAKRLVDAVNSRFPAVNIVNNDYGKRVFSIAFFESIVVFNIDARRSFICAPTTNGGISGDAKDFKFKSTAQAAIADAQDALEAKSKRIPLLYGVQRRAFRIVHYVVARFNSRKLKRFFD